MATLADFQLTFTLKQHTPLIHFHDHEGATLRATELKPKLDKFIVEQLGGWDKVDKNWLIGKGKAEHKALDYKVTITPATSDSWKDYIEEPIPDGQGGWRFKERDGIKSTETKSYPLFFGNMGKDYEVDALKKFILSSSEQKVQIFSFNPTLKNEVAKYIATFFCRHNFGNRQFKGFGSYFPIDKDISFDEKQFDYKFEIALNASPKNKKEFFKELYEKISVFYSALRGGLNVKSFVKRNGEKVKDADGQFIMRDDFYFKSLLFLYFKNQKTPVQWEKKTIKESFFPITKRNNEGRLVYRGLNDQKAARVVSNDLPLYFSAPNKLLVRDLLGLSSEEQWQSYKDSIKKKEAEKDHNGNWKAKKESDNNAIQRFASPIFFKPIITGNKATIYIRLDKVGIVDKDFMIENKYGKPFHLSTPTTFDLKDFFEFIKNPVHFDIDTHVENINGFHDRSEFKFLKNTFQSLTKI